ncbi:MAG: FkbM family methyltransferase [Bacteroidales bacterium]
MDVAAEMMQDDTAAATLAQAQREYQAGRLDHALALYDTVLKDNPKNAAALSNRGVILRALGRPDEALASYKRALDVAPEAGEAWVNLANLMSAHGKWAEAADAYGRAAQLLPKQPMLRNQAAHALLSAGDVRRARAAFAALTRDPVSGLDAMIGLCACYRRDRRMEAAQALAERIASAYPQDARSHAALAETLFVAGRFEQAEVPLRRALSLEPDNLGIRCRLGQLMVSLRQWDRAEQELSEVLRRDPDNLDARLGWARLRLLRLEIPDAWNDYSWRWRRATASKPRFTQPEWGGEPRPGETLLIYTEQGLGDTIQFARFIERAAARVGRVILLAPPPLQRILQGVAGISELLVAGTADLPAFDCHLALMELPRVLSLGLADLGCHAPYLKVPAEPKLRRKAQMQGFRVGIVWAGNPAHDNDAQRSVTVERFLPLMRHPELRLIGLQKGVRAADAAELADILPNLDADLTDMGATAAVLEELDLVITVDSAVAHLAGALGRPVWMLTPYAPDWRWGGQGEDTPWYPSMRLLRQPAPGDWDSVFRRIDIDLGDMLQPGRGKLMPSAATTADGRPRFVMELPRHLLRDAGINFLLTRETRFRGYEASTRAFLDAHLRENDLFVDVGAHWGLMTLHAVTAKPGIRALAIEASPDNYPHLRRSIAVNGLGARVRTVHSGAWDGEGVASVTPESTMGHSVRPGEGPGPAIKLATVDSLLAAHPDFAQGRVIMKVDVEGAEPEVLTGARGLLSSGRVAALIWERGLDYDNQARHARLLEKLAELEALGFSHWRFAHEDAGGPLVPYVPGPELTNIISLARGEAPLPVYVTDGRRPLPVKPMRREALVPATRTAFVQRLIELGVPDAGYWACPRPQDADAADQRARLAASLLATSLPDGAGSVLDLGAGMPRLPEHLPAGTAYTAIDLLPWPGVHHAMNLDAGDFPEGRWDAVTLLAVLPHLHHGREVLAKARNAATRLVLTYPTTDLVAGEMLRRGRGYFNDFDRQALLALLEETGWQVESETTLGDEGVWQCR